MLCWSVIRATVCCLAKARWTSAPRQIVMVDPESSPLTGSEPTWRMSNSSILDWVTRSFRGRTSFLAASGHRGAPSLPGLPTQEIADKSFGGFDAMLPQQATQLQHLLVAADGRLGSVLANRRAARLRGGAPAAAAAAAAAGGASVAEAAVVREVRQDLRTRRLLLRSGRRRRRGGRGGGGRAAIGRIRARSIKAASASPLGGSGPCRRGRRLLAGQQGRGRGHRRGVVLRSRAAGQPRQGAAIR
mmetsp:Transcript_38527/g.123866  ORF Transcript_38527/g.123866 Transcript_38527/m.123866 type:complete len:245 (-) Transcript_38527:311-1045(-)